MSFLEEGYKSSFKPWDLIKKPATLLYKKSEMFGNGESFCEKNDVI